MVSKVARTSPAKVASSRAGRTSPVSKVVSNASFQEERPGVAGPFLIYSFTSVVTQLPLPD